MSRLDHIAARQRTSRFRDVLFAALVLAVGAASISTVTHGFGDTLAQLAGR
jgi:hypothetical protein